MIISHNTILMAQPSTAIVNVSSGLALHPVSNFPSTVHEVFEPAPPRSGSGSKGGRPPGGCHAGPDKTLAQREDGNSQ
jgi:hypothetical protein